MYTPWAKVVFKACCVVSLMCEIVDTVELDRLIRRKEKLYGCRLVRIEVLPSGLMEFAYACYVGIHDLLVPIDLSKTSCYYFLRGRMERIPQALIEDFGIAIEGGALKNTFCITCLEKKVAIVHVY